jgi:hypothetical protein
VEAASVDDPCDHLADVVALRVVLRDDSVELSRVVERLLGRRGLPRRLRFPAGEVRDDLARERERVLVADGVVVGNTRHARVNLGAAELLRTHFLAGRGLHERRAAEEDRAGAADDHGLVAHRGDVCTPGGARAHHDRDLRYPPRGHAGLVVEDAAEVIAVGKDLVLHGKERSARVDEVEARKVVLLGHLLCAEVLLDRERVVRAALDRCVIRHDDAFDPLDDADSRDDSGAGRVASVELPGRERVQLEKR